jgi:signal transduction histidine kinase/CheY-like chemotaxis protein
VVFESEGKVEPWAVEYRAYGKAGHELWMESKPTLMTDPANGRVVGFTDVMRDVTSRKALEAKLRLAQADAEAATAVKTEFLANMSHELRTPLTSIIGFTGLAGEQPDLAPLTRTYVERVGDASRALLCTVNDILDFSKLEAGQVSIQAQPVSLAKLAQASLDLFTPQAGAKDLALVLDGEGADLTLSIDPDRIRQILLNLVGNAVKFTQDGGVTLRTCHDVQSQTLKVEVVDTGAGIPSDKLNLLFQRFSQVDGALTRAHGGTGLGLAICKGLVEAMGGEIGADSVVGQGSRFWFTIPAPLAQAAQAAPDGSAATQPTFAGVRVLVVDDHAANRELARLFLAGVGAEVTEASDGEEAVVLSSEQPFDVILMDIRMPHLDGPGALQAIRAAPGPNDATPILAFTADADHESQLLALGFQDVVAKPLQSGALIAAVARASDFTPQLGRAAHAG